MQRTVNEIAIEMHEDLGNPDAKVELSITKAERQWYKALAEFNYLVGRWNFRTFSAPANQSTYSVATVFASATDGVQSVRQVFFPEESVVESFGIEGLSSDVDEILRGSYESTAIKETLIKKAIPKDFQFITPDTLMLIPAPTEDSTYLALLQENYTPNSLDDRYETIVTDYAKVLCLEIIANARARLNTPMRVGETVKYSNREATLYKQAELMRNRFYSRCDELILSRGMFNDFSR